MQSSPYAYSTSKVAPYTQHHTSHPKPSALICRWLRRWHLLVALSLDLPGDTIHNVNADGVQDEV